MQSRSILNELLIIILVVLTLHLAALRYSLYWSVWWFDFAPHFLGGAWVGLFTVWFFRWSPYARFFSVSDVAIVALLASALVVGIGWEFFEYMLGVAVSPEQYSLDTALDITLDLCGAYAAARYALRRGYLRGESLTRRAL